MGDDNQWRINKIVDAGKEEEFSQAIKENLALKDDENRHILLYIHGYNNSFTDAAICAAKLGDQINRDGLTALFSWPSHDNEAQYWADREEIEASEKQIADFISLLAKQVDAQKVHIFAHSMGNRGLLRAIEHLMANAALDKLQFGQIILAAADVGPELFKNLTVNYPNKSVRTTLYVSSEDKALTLAKKMLSMDRVGLNPPVTIVSGIDTLEVTEKVYRDFWGHGYVIDSRQVLNDIHELVWHSTQPGKRAAVTPVNDDFGSYWRLF